MSRDYGKLGEGEFERKTDMNLSIARTPPTVASRRHARTGGQRKMIGRLYGYARMSVATDADANNLEKQRRVLADCEQVL